MTETSKTYLVLPVLCSNINLWLAFSLSFQSLVPPSGPCPLYSNQSMCVWISHSPMYSTSPSYFIHVDVIINTINLQHYVQSKQIAYCLSNTSTKIKNSSCVWWTVYDLFWMIHKHNGIYSIKLGPVACSMYTKIVFVQSITKWLPFLCPCRLQLRVALGLQFSFIILTLSPFISVL